MIVGIHEIAKTKGEGWVEHKWADAEEMQIPKEAAGSSKMQLFPFEFQGEDMFGRGGT